MTTPANTDPFSARTTLSTPLGDRTIYQLDAVGDISKLPISIRVLLEAVLRNLDNYIVTEDHVKALANYDATNVGEVEIPHKPGRVVLQDFTGVPAVVDLAAMRSGIVRMTGNESDAQKVNPLVQCDLVIDHSVQVDAFNSGIALTINADKEFERNNERYTFLKWGQQAFNNFAVVPPATGIVHQVNLEYLAKVVWQSETTPYADAEKRSAEASGTPTLLYPDSLVGTDSHTTMINGLGVLGWGVGGIEAEAVMLGQPIYMLIPQVVGMKLTGKLREGVTATDMVLVITEMLRNHPGGVVGKFVEFFGTGLDEMPLANRATIANMAPEYGATIGFFPVDQKTLDYLHLSGRDEKLIATVEQYCKANRLWRSAEEEANIVYTDTVELDLATVEPSLSGPKRPQDRIPLSDMQPTWQKALATTFNKPTNAPTPTLSESASEASGTALATKVEVSLDNQTFTLEDGHIVIAAITSCTNTSNPEVMIAAGLVARKAAARGLARKPWVKTSLAPGSKVVTEYYDQANLTKDLEALGFYTVGYGCTTCIGNSGPLPPEISKAINENDLVACSVLSGNRNFEGRISPDVRANYLASPPLVVAYAITGTVNTDLQNDSLGQDQNGNDVFLKDLWPTQQEVMDLVATCVTREQFIEQYANVAAGPEKWQAIDAPEGQLFAWDDTSTYIQEPPFFQGLTQDVSPITSITGARVLCKLGDSITTDHISPAGAIKRGTPAANYLDANNVPVSMYNSFGSRRGNDQVMTRGTFANIRVKNELAKDAAGNQAVGGFTVDFSGLPTQDTFTPIPDDAPKTGVGGAPVRYIYDAVQNYKAADAIGGSDTPTPTPTLSESASEASGIPLIVLAGTDYGMGSSRDWAAKGTYLLGVKAVIATSFERIHRSNLVGMGVLPLTFAQGQDADSLGLDGTESFHIEINDDVKPRQQIKVTATKPTPSCPPTPTLSESASEASGTPQSPPHPITFTTTCRIDTPVEVDYYRNGGILHTVLRNMAKG